MNINFEELFKQVPVTKKRSEKERKSALHFASRLIDLIAEAKQNEVSDYEMVEHALTTLRAEPSLLVEEEFTAAGSRVIEWDDQGKPLAAEYEPDEEEVIGEADEPKGGKRKNERK